MAANEPAYCDVIERLQFVLQVMALRCRRLLKGGSTLVTLPRIVTPYRDSVDGTRARVTYQKLVTR